MSDKVRNFFNRCEHPRIIKNKYTGEPVYVECGVCPHCLISRSDAKRNLCDYEKWNRKYCYFVTLTYNSQYVPKMALVPIEDYEFDYPVGRQRKKQKEKPTRSSYPGIWLTKRTTFLISIVTSHGSALIFSTVSQPARHTTAIP